MADGAHSAVTAVPASSNGGMEALTAWASEYASKRGFTPAQLLKYLKTADAAQEKKERKSQAAAPPWTPSTVTLPARAAKGARVWVTLIGDTRAVRGAPLGARAHRCARAGRGRSAARLGGNHTTPIG